MGGSTYLIFVYLHLCNATRISGLRLYILVRMYHIQT